MISQNLSLFLFLQFTMENSEASLRAPATPCSINLACNSPDESPTGVRGDCEVKTPPVPTKSRSGRQEVLEIYPVRVTWHFFFPPPYCLSLEICLWLPMRWLLILIDTVYIFRTYIFFCILGKWELHGAHIEHLQGNLFLKRCKDVLGGYLAALTRWKSTNEIGLFQGLNGRAPQWASQLAGMIMDFTAGTFLHYC